MKKYQLKYNTGTELEVVYSSEIIYEIICYILRSQEDLRFYSIWMDGKVLD